MSPLMRVTKGNMLTASKMSVYSSVRSVQRSPLPATSECRPFVFALAVQRQGQNCGGVHAKIIKNNSRAPVTVRRHRRSPTPGHRERAPDHNVLRCKWFEDDCIDNRAGRKWRA
jgi:hypothetical protein